MRVTHVQRAAGIGGSERHLLMLLPALGERGIDVNAVVLRTPGGEMFSAALEAARVPTSVIDMTGHLDRRAVSSLAQLVRSSGADLIHTHLLHADLHGQLAAKRAGVAAVSTVHGTPAPYRTLQGWIAGALAGRLAARTIAISEHVAGFLRRRRLVPPSRIEVIPYGIDPEPWDLGAAAAGDTTLRDDSDDVVVLMASRLIPHKGHDFLLDGFEAAVSLWPKLRLVIAGDGPLRPELERRVASMRAESRVEFLGFVDSLPATMAASDIVAFPTMPGFGEGFGLVNLEAMAAGKPVVGTSIDSIPEIVADRETGLLVEPGDVSALSRALVSLASSERLRAEMGRAGRRRAVEAFGYERMVESTVKVYGQVLGSSVGIA